ncbi:hypothetical protein [Streptomyces sp. NPDC058955]
MSDVLIAAARWIGRGAVAVIDFAILRQDYTHVRDRIRRNRPRR